ncbi:MAG TPA: hypothetical protein VGS07_31010 [Thermoanaerobaculia bacterium]|jgi:hypothetical protein|nr:hypothetical protein [Thermoanaerobaculia bacterium]
MSLFDFPRINLTGTLTMNPGTANNDDYAPSATLPDGYGPYTGQPLALIDSKLVEPRTYGMSDADFIAWVQKAQTFDVSSGPPEIIPAEWNYYGGMNSKLNPPNFSPASVIGVTTAPGQVHTSPDSGIPVTSLLGATLAFSGHFTDVNSEGSPPATQFFIDNLTLTQGSQTWLSGGTSKGACQWLNFYRNINLTADAGAGGYVYHVMLKSSGATINIPGFDDPSIVGVIFRYYLYQPAQTIEGNEAIEALYQKKGANSSVIQLVATFAPLYDTETIFTTPVGRLMVANTPNIQTPKGTLNNGGPSGPIALAPAVLSVDGEVISADFSGTFPEYYQAGANPKYDFGTVSLVVTNGTDSATVAAVSYTDVAAGNQGGWLFDFDISENPQAQQILAGGYGGNATFQLVNATYGVVLAETEYYLVTNQQAIYAEQGGSGTQFVNQGSQEPASVSVFRYGQELAAGSCPPITVWQYASVPLQKPGNAEPIENDYQPGQPISVKTDQPGNFLFTFTVEGQAPPPTRYSIFQNPPYITNWPQISLRILPNTEDFSPYFADPAAPEPVGNDQLTFDVVYQKVLRTYYLLYPAMNKIFELNNESAVAGYAQAILDATSPAPANWMSSGYMPRTRDMSNSRRTLLQAWCRKVPAGD